jgi:hypothetical protein
VRISLKALEHDGHDKALRSVGATRFTPLFSSLCLRYPIFLACFILGWIRGDDGIDNAGDDVIV